MNEFEQKLQRQPLKKIPGDWRAEILREGRRVAVREIWDAETASLPKSTGLSTFVIRLSTFFWPHPKAWGALAAVWIFIFILNFSTRDTSPRLAEKLAPPSPEIIVELKKQQRMFAELAGTYETTDADRPRIFSPRPRSERGEILMT